VEQRDDDERPLATARVTRFDLEADVVVVGLGCAGACAAIEAAHAGADVLVLERAGGGGGTSANSGGQIYMGGGTALQRACGFEDSPEQMFRYLMASCGPGPDERLVQAFCEHSPAHFDWLVEQGVPFKASFFPDAHEPPQDDGLTYSGSEDVHPFCEIARPAPRGHCPQVVGSKGPLLMQRLLGGAQRAGARMQFGARVERLICESDGRVAGVVARGDGAARCVRARRGVVLCAGGFIFDDAMLELYAPQLRACRLRLGTEGDDGRGIRIALAAGAAALRMDAGDVTLPLVPPVALRKGVLVNRAGQRFINEDAYMGRLGEYALLRQGGQVFLIVDDAIFARPELFPVEIAAVGETFAELEAELGLPAPALHATLELYNRYAERGLDPLFHKRPAQLAPLVHPPFAALDLGVERYTYAVFTLGGLHIDARGAVLTPAGEPLPGLFAAGRTTSGIAKQGYSSGLSLGDASFFGRQAGRHAAV
jgi:3-oxo-5alpha-steroid 4-dehydrogenase